ncbi:MAG: tetratricopeptide repeat protein [Planctomycetaceae bacterium]
MWTLQTWAVVLYAEGSSLSESVMSEPTIASVPELSSSPPLQGERVTFTGTLGAMTHAQAAAIVVQHGGEATEHVSGQTTMLVVGEEGWPLEEDGQPSVKLQQVTQRNAEGASIRVVNEADFLHLVGLSERRDEVRRLYTPAMLSRLLDVPVHVIRGWERAGLIRPVQKIYRLPHFDFREVNGARTLSHLLEAGVPRVEIERSLRNLPERWGGGDRPLEQLELLERDRHVVVRDQHGYVTPSNGQRLFDFEPMAEETTSSEISGDEDHASIPFLQKVESDHWSARDWFVEGCRHYVDGEVDSAIESFRLSLMTEPDNPEVHFHLAECLYRQKHTRAALERYYVAAELDHEYLEAWTQVGCVHRELGHLESALDAFDIALDVHPDYADAHYHRAETLYEMGRAEEAIDHWQTYLEHDSRGPWADTARQRLANLRSEI